MIQHNNYPQERFPSSAAFTPDGKLIYTAQPEQNTVTIPNSVDYTINTVVTVGAPPIRLQYKV
ncbi:hypothetical protein P4380_12160 [Bacillus thuringiensis]|uniref:hypothetical protein n=1 Tax=Bacillus thuringiensis TaxID=1428 RepID=UPI001E3BEF84|nr:hypothetical protein [Bacillus thuringiensis]MCR6868542.1 hypothetical protein [Bacillus thuringiensis]MED3217137.1 hypothetical protein [Bacillus thuringiensis]MED3595013.1 hypothetical protein [Bacillus thuringiensis]